MKKLVKPMLRILVISIITAVAFLLLVQHRIIYYPRPYDKAALWDLEQRGGSQWEVRTSQGKQVALYLPPPDAPAAPPQFLWLVFGGNGSLALDYDGEPRHWDQRFSYLFVDYPGYGLCEGSPNPDRIQETIQQLAAKIRTQFGWSEEDLQARCGVIGHSLGCAVSLMAADELKLDRAILCAPFTTLTDMGRLLIGWPLCLLNQHRYDNVARLKTLAERSAKVVIFHGVEDEVIPVSMARSLQTSFPTMIRLHEVAGCGHNEIVMGATQEIGLALVELVAVKAD